jgi:hypothetical protein
LKRLGYASTHLAISYRLQPAARSPSAQEIRHYESCSILQTAFTKYLNALAAEHPMQDREARAFAQFAIEVAQANKPRLREIARTDLI